MLVVDQFEVVQIDQHHRQRTPLVFGMQQHLAQRGQDAGAVEQAGEFVVGGLEREFGARRFQIALVLFQLGGALGHQLLQFALAPQQFGGAPTQQSDHRRDAQQHVSDNGRNAPPPRWHQLEPEAGDRAAAALVGIHCLHFQRVTAWRQQRVGQVAERGAGPAGLMAFDPVTEADAVRAALRPRGAEFHIQRHPRPRHPGLRQQRLAAAAHMQDVHPQRRRGEHAHRIQQVGQATAAAEPDAAIGIFEKCIGRHVVPQQPFRARGPRPTSVLVHIQALAAAQPQPAPAVVTAG